MINSKRNINKNGVDKNQKTIQNPLILTEIPNFSSAIVIGVRAGRDANRRLGGLGLTPGTKIRRLSSAPFRGPVQIEVRGTRLAIGRGLASKILLKNVERYDQNAD